MAFVLTCLYIFFSFVRIMELYPELVSLRLLLWLALVCLTVSVFTWGQSKPRNRSSLREVQIWLTVVFFILAVFGWGRIGWWDEMFASIDHLDIILGGFVMLVLNLTNLKRIKILVMVFVTACIVMTMQGMAAYYFNWQRQLFIVEWHPGEDNPDAVPDPEQQIEAPRMRNIGFLSDPNDLAQTLAMALPFIGMAWQKRRVLRNWLVLFPIGAYLSYGIYLTHSRGGILAVVVMILMALRERIGPIKAGILTFFLVTALLAFNITAGRALRDESSDARVEAWASGIIMLRENPLLGVNYNNFAEAHGRGITAHNSFDCALPNRA